MPERIALATFAGLPVLGEDDRLLQAALRERGHVAEPVVWDSPEADWQGYDAVVVRSCWDYHLRPAEFRGWVDAMERGGAALWNPPAVLRWNADKRYLRELEAAGVPTVPTRWFGAAERATLAEVLEETGWSEAVVKPVVSASAFETWRTSAATAARDGARLRALSAGRELMLQPFVPEVVTAGEWSLVFLGGEFSHAVLKRPASGDFRVQVEHGGTASAASPGPALVAEARAALDAVPGPWLYARVDGCIIEGRFRVMELELLEPSLFLAQDPRAPARFADAIERAGAGVLR